MDYTTKLKLGQPAYLSNGKTAVIQVNANFAIIDALISNILCYEGNVLTHNNEVLIYTP